MSDYFFFSTKITQKQVEEIIRTAGYDPTDYNYQPLLENKGFLVTGDVPMAESKLKFAAKKLDITVEIRAGANDAGPVQLSSAAALAGTVYTVDFINSTPDTWTLGVYQTLPASPGLTSVSWKQTTVPRSGESGVQWTVDYLVGIANYSQVGGKGVYKASQKLATNLGQRWAARFEGGAQQLFPNGSANPGQVVIDNESGDFANLAIGMDGDIALIQKAVYSGNNAQFEVAPTYWVALFKDVQRGEVISGNQVHGPLQARFPAGVTTLTYKAYIDGKQFVFEDSLGQRQSALKEDVDRRVRQLSAA